MNTMNESIMPRTLSIQSDSTLTQVFWIMTFSLATAIAAQIEIPHYPVPFTLQTFVVLLAGGLLGKRNGAMSMTLYLILGAVGLPVFSSWGFGLARLAGPTGGYLLAFPLAVVAIAGIMRYGRQRYWTVAAMVAGLLIIFSMGTLQLKIVTGMTWTESFGAGFLIFSWWDLLKLGAAVAIVEVLKQKENG